MYRAAEADMSDCIFTNAVPAFDESAGHLNANATNWKENA